MTLLAHGPVTHEGGTALAAGIAFAVAVGYVALALARSREPRGWNPWRTCSFLLGTGLLILGAKSAATTGFGHHMLGHLLIGMFAPTALVLAAPVTLILRSVTPRYGRLLVHALRSAPARTVSHPAVVLTANLGGLVLSYFTPLFTVASSNTLVHQLVHLHFFIGGYLFAWLIVGPDPGPDRPSVRSRIVILGVAVAGHSVISQLLYGGFFVSAPIPPDELRDAGTLMYYWGDIAEMLLAVALLSSWRRASGIPGVKAQRMGSPVRSPWRTACCPNAEPRSRLTTQSQLYGTSRAADYSKSTLRN